MSNQTDKNDQNNRSQKKLIERLRTVWQEKEFLKITFSDLENEADIDVQEIRQIIDGDTSTNNNSGEAE